MNYSNGKDKQSDPSSLDKGCKGASERTKSSDITEQQARNIFYQLCFECTGQYKYQRGLRRDCIGQDRDEKDLGKFSWVYREKA